MEGWREEGWDFTWRCPCSGRRIRYHKSGILPRCSVLTQSVGWRPPFMASPKQDCQGGEMQRQLKNPFPFRGDGCSHWSIEQDRGYSFVPSPLSCLGNLRLHSHYGMSKWEELSCVGGGVFAFFTRSRRGLSKELTLQRTESPKSGCGREDDIWICSVWSRVHLGVKRLVLMLFLKRRGETREQKGRVKDTFLSLRMKYNEPRC